MAYELHFLTGHDAIDGILVALVSKFESELSGQVLAYYLNGSYASNYGIQSSDVDVMVILVADTPQEDIERAYKMVSDLNAKALVELDIGFLRSDEMVRPGLAFRGQLIYGEDVRDQLTVMPLDFWARERMHAGCWLICHLHNRAGYAYLPLNFPDAEGEFFGYDDRVARSREGDQQPGLKNMMRASGWAATGLVARHTNQYVTDKTECVRMYREHIGDEWSDHLDTLFNVCRMEWSYRVPDGEAEREQLRAICDRNLGFENHYLSVYRTFLVDELQCGEFERQKDALYFLAQTPFCDDEVLENVQVLKADSDFEKQVKKVMRAYEKVA